MLRCLWSLYQLAGHMPVRLDQEDVVITAICLILVLAQGENLSECDLIYLGSGVRAGWKFDNSSLYIQIWGIDAKK